MMKNKNTGNRIKLFEWKSMDNKNRNTKKLNIRLMNRNAVPSEDSRHFFSRGVLIFLSIIAVVIVMLLAIFIFLYMRHKI
jgi:hypothetical protein